jgi:hypothetical protein
VPRSHRKREDPEVRPAWLRGVLGWRQLTSGGELGCIGPIERGAAARKIVSKHASFALSVRGQPRVSELRALVGIGGHRRESDSAQPSTSGTLRDGSDVLAMQKVEGSRPFIRFTRPAVTNPHRRRGSRHSSFAPLLTRARDYIPLQGEYAARGVAWCAVAMW